MEEASTETVNIIAVDRPAQLSASQKREQDDQDKITDSPRRTNRPKTKHDYCLLDDPWPDDPCHEEGLMSSAELVYAAFSETTIAHPKSLKEAKKTPE